MGLPITGPARVLRPKRRRMRHQRTGHHAVTCRSHLPRAPHGHGMEEIYQLNRAEVPGFREDVALLTDARFRGVEGACMERSEALAGGPVGS